MEIQLPSGVDFNRLRKDSILWLFNHYCQHGHRFTEHPQCFLDQYKDKLATTERIGILDIEASNLQGDFGYIISYALKVWHGEIMSRAVAPEEIYSNKFDRLLMQQFTHDVRDFDRLVVYYGGKRRFDIPYLRTRALRWGIPFPEWKSMYVTDVYDLVKPLLRLHRNRLENACDLLGIESKQHRLNPEVWMRAQAGNRKALAYILLHNKEDVISLERVYDKLKGFRGQDKTSI